jgi:hypothetical protein
VNINQSETLIGTLLPFLILAAVSFGLFKLIVGDLKWESLNTPTKYGKWFSAWMIVGVIMTSSSYLKGLDAEYFYRLFLVGIPTTLIAFLVGFFWGKFKIQNGYSKNQESVTTSITFNNKLILFGVLGLVVVGGVYLALNNSGSKSFSAYGCKEVGPFPTQECGEREYKFTVTFKVDKQKSEVFAVYKRKNGDQNIIKLEKCSVFDEKNWKCGGGYEVSPGSGGAFSTVWGSQQMINGFPTYTDTVITYSRGGRSVKEYLPSVKFQKD